MPQYTLVIWNLQNFGSGSEKWGADGVWRANFIARYMRSIGADMLGVIEVSPHGLESVRQLLRSLNANQALAVNRDWAFDLIKSGLVNDVALDSSDATTWNNGGPRREGYAFYWRTGRGFTIVPAARPISEGAENRAAAPALPANNYLDLVTQGRPVELAGGAWSITGGYTKASLFPIKNNAPVDPWPALDFLTVARGGSSRPTYQSTRRPAFVVIKTKAGTDRTTLVPVLFFHSPSYGPLAEASVAMSSFSREHYVTYPLDNGQPDTDELTVIDNVVSAGDYNYSASADWPGMYFRYTRAYSKTPDGGVASVAILTPPGDTQTTIQLDGYSDATGRYSGDPIESDDADDYRKMSIDNLFVRGLGRDAGTGTENLIETVMENDNAMKNSIKAFKAYLDELYDENDYFDANRGPYSVMRRKRRGGGFFDDDVYALPGITDWGTLYADVRRGYFTTARSAAEFVRNFVSDHLPLILKFTV